MESSIAKQKKEITINRDMSIKEIKEIIEKYGVWGTDKTIECIYNDFERVEKELFQENKNENIK